MSTPGGPPNQPPSGQPGPPQQPSGTGGPAQQQPPNGPPSPPTGAATPPPSTPPPSTPPPGGTGRKLLPLILAAVVLGSLLTVGGLYLGGVFSSDDPDEIRIEPVATVAADPFTPPVGPDVKDLPPPKAPVAVPASPGAPVTAAPTTPAAVPGVVSGGKPGLYGGTGEDRCDKAQLIRFLQENPAKATAWAGVVGIPVADIPTYVNGLAEVILQTDTKVTNHGFKNDKATRVPATLQAGTRVLVDNRGMPVAKCACGNPLLGSTPISNPKYVGQPWPGFDPMKVTTIQPSPTPLTVIPVQNVYTNTVYPVTVTSTTPAITSTLPTSVPATPVAPTSVAPTTVAPTTTTPAPVTTPPIATPTDPLLPGTYRVTSELVGCTGTPCTLGTTDTYTFDLACAGPTDCTIDGRSYTRNGTVLTSTGPVTGAAAYECNGTPAPTSDSVSLDVARTAGSPPTAQTLLGQLVLESRGSACGDVQLTYALTYTRI